jgi:hypothetical protein
MIALNLSVPTAAQISENSNNLLISVMQLSVKLPISIAETQLIALVKSFQTSTREIATCDDAVGVARSFNAEIVYKKNVNPQKIPQVLSSELRRKAIGSATEVFRSGGTIRVLLRCPESFRINAKDSRKDT